jgi:hypothetical protein
VLFEKAPHTPLTILAFDAQLVCDLGKLHQRRRSDGARHQLAALSRLSCSIRARMLRMISEF